MSPEEAWNIYTQENTLLSWAKIVDCGDVRMTYLDNTVALKQLDKAHQVSPNHSFSLHYRLTFTKIISGQAAKVMCLESWCLVEITPPHFQHLGQLSTDLEQSLLSTSTVTSIPGSRKYLVETCLTMRKLNHDMWLINADKYFSGVNHGTFLHIAHGIFVYSDNEK
jgi:hypothetical protein